MRQNLRFLAALLAFGFVPSAGAEIMQGEHVVITGFGAGIPSTDIKAFQEVDLDLDGITENAGGLSKRIGRRGFSGFVQYHYFILPYLALGVEANVNKFRIAQTVNGLGSLPLSGGFLPTDSEVDFETSSLLTQYLVTARYVIFPDRQLNPYLSAGIGFNTFSGSVRIFPNEAARSLDGPFPPTNLPYTERTLYDRTSLGFAGVLGGGIQATLWKRFLLGIEGRWSYSVIDPGKFGANSANFAAGHFWLGWRWMAPL